MATPWILYRISPKTWPVIWELKWRVAHTSVQFSSVLFTQPHPASIYRLPTYVYTMHSPGLGFMMDKYRPGQASELPCAL